MGQLMKLKHITNLAIAMALSQTLSAQTDYFEVGKETLADLIEIESTESAGLATQASEYVAEKLKSAGFAENDLKIIGPTETTKGLAAFLRGQRSDHPVIVMAHIDVVDAVKEAWATDPFQMVEKNGYFYGRGTSDDKGGATALITNFIRLKEENFVPNNDIIMLLTGDEETKMAGIAYFKDHLEGVKKAAFALNADSGFVKGTLDAPKAFLVQTAEKVYVTLKLEARNPGGHSSVPRKDNAIYDLMHALTRLEQHQFDISLNETTRGYLKGVAADYPEPLSGAIQMIAEGKADHGDIDLIDRNPPLNAQIRTTCVATQLLGGHVENALPVYANATVNCRVLPHEDPDQIAAIIAEIAGPLVTVTQTARFMESPPSPLSEEITKILQNAVNKVFQGVEIIPEMSTGATDGMVIRSAGIPVYGIDAMVEDPSGGRAHGANERIDVEGFAASIEFWYEIMTQL